MVKRHPLLFFFSLAFLLSWAEWIIVLIRKSGPGGPDPLGVFVAAVVVTAVAGKSNLKDFFRRLFRWRVGVQWYALVLLSPIAVCAIAIAANVALGAPMPTGEKLRGWPELLGRFVFIFLFIGLGEEPGWRGFALPQLQNRFSPMAASAILGCIWAFWHLPLMGTEFTLPVIPAFLLSLFAATFIMTWIYNRTRGSILLPMLLHSTVNTIGAGFLFPMFSGADVLRLWYLYAGIWAFYAIILIASGKLNSAPGFTDDPGYGTDEPSLVRA